MSVPRFEILLDHNKTYLPGQDVTGHILFDITGKTKVKTICDCLCVCFFAGYDRL